MEVRNLLMTTIAIFGIALFSKAQVPNYVPSNGLVGWWPFNGNANDESLNGNNGTLNGPILSSDRFGNTNSSYNFANTTDFISVNPTQVNITGYTFTAWFKKATDTGGGTFFVGSMFPSNVYGLLMGVGNNLEIGFGAENGSNSVWTYSNFANYFDNDWHFISAVYSCNSGLMIDSTNLTILVDNVILVKDQRVFGNDQSQVTSPINNNINTIIGNYTYNQNGSFRGILDDIGIWNRALSQEEITELFNAPNCSNNLTISPALNQLEIGNTANLNATTSDTNPSYVWQSDFGQGFQTLNNYGNYSGVNTNSLTISNIQLSEHNQPIRVISTSGECIDTSNVASINITDTCIVTINDTITTLISVTDTLVINTLITGLTPPNNLNTIKVFPNPSNSYITIDFGNFESMNGYTLTITNSIGQTIYTTPINEQSSYIDLSTWNGNGIYFVQIIDTLNNTIENRKIVLQ
jgi:hypothetical protein